MRRVVIMVPAHARIFRPCLFRKVRGSLLLLSTKSMPSAVILQLGLESHLLDLAPDLWTCLGRKLGLWFFGEQFLFAKQRTDAVDLLFGDPAFEASLGEVDGTSPSNLVILIKHKSAHLRVA